MTLPRPRPAAVLIAALGVSLGVSRAVLPSGAPAPPRPARVLVFGSTRCPCADGYTSRLLSLDQEYRSRGVRFEMYFADPRSTREEIARYASERRLTFPVFRDQGAAAAKRWGVVATPTVVVLRPNGAVAYRGRIDDSPEPVAVRRHYLREALDAVIAGRGPTVARTAPLGCGIQGKPNAAPIAPIALDPGLGRVSFPVTAAGTEVQQYFNQGMARWFGFNFTEAERTFQEVVRRDPKCAMGWWGLALSRGFTYNLDNGPDQRPKARDAIQKAVELSAALTAKEQALIRALAVRAGGPGPQEAVGPYRDAMAGVYLAYPDDANIAVLYAASIMDLRPWALWKTDGTPEPGTLEAVLVLEGVLRREPEHIGAIHYYIHATEASGYAARALPYARKLADLAPQSGHLVHMPSHTFIRVGEYLDSAVSNNRAAAIDRAYFAGARAPTPYAGYYLHNLDFLIASYLAEGRSSDAVEAARELAEVVARLTPDQAPIWCGSSSSVISVYARCGRWDEILRAAAPPAGNPLSVAVWRFARCLARLGKGDLPAAERELTALRADAAAAERAVPDIPLPGFTDSNRKFYALMAPVAAGRIALRRGQTEEGLRLLRRAVEIENAMPYLEPPVWRFPVRETLGAALVKLRRFGEAEQTFREDLRRNPKSGRSLLGLAAALEAKGQSAAAAEVRKQFDTAWRRADVKLSVEDL